MFPTNRGKVTDRGLLLRNLVECPCIYYYFPYSRRECTKPQNSKPLHIDVPNTPKIGCLARYGLLFFFNSISSKYYKPAHPSPPASIILSLEIFLFGIALSFRLQCLKHDMVSCRMNGAIAGRPTRQTDTIGSLPIMVILAHPLSCGHTRCRHAMARWRSGTTVFITKFHILVDFVRALGSEREVGPRRKLKVEPPIMTDRDCEITNSFHRIENPPRLHIHSGPGEHDGPS